MDLDIVKGQVEEGPDVVESVWKQTLTVRMIIHIIISILDNGNKPITPKKHRRLLLLPIGSFTNDPEPWRTERAPIQRLLRARQKGVFPLLLACRGDDGLCFVGRETRVFGQQAR